MSSRKELLQDVGVGLGAILGGTGITLGLARAFQLPSSEMMSTAQWVAFHVTWGLTIFGWGVIIQAYVTLLQRASRKGRKKNEVQL